MKYKYCLYKTEGATNEDDWGLFYYNKLMIEASDGTWIQEDELESYERNKEFRDQRYLANYYRFNTPDLIEVFYYEV